MQSQHEKFDVLRGECTRFKERGQTSQREFLLSFGIEVTEYHGTPNCLIITQENGVTAL